MKKFITKAFLFSLPLVLLSIAADYIMSYNLGKSKDHAAGEFIVWNDIYDKKINTDILIYGSSRAWVHINPQMIEDSLEYSAYNLGMDGQTFPTQYFRHREYFKHNKNPEYIIYSLDLYSLEREAGLYNIGQFLPYSLWHYDLYKCLQPYENKYNFYDFAIPLHRFIGNEVELELIEKQLKNEINIPPLRHKGYAGMERQWNTDLDEKKTKLKSIEVNFDKEVVKLFDDFLKECKQKNIKVILVYTPTYYKGKDFIKNYDEVFRFYEDLSRKYDLPFLNYSNLPLCREKKYFYNYSHLNKQGSLLFTKVLIEDLKEHIN